MVFPGGEESRAGMGGRCGSEAAAEVGGRCGGSGFLRTYTRWAAPALVIGHWVSGGGL